MTVSNSFRSLDCFPEYQQLLTILEAEPYTVLMLVAQRLSLSFALLQLNLSVSLLSSFPLF